MNNALIALEEIKRDHIHLYPQEHNEDGSIRTVIEFEKEFDIIEQALKDAEAREKDFVELNTIDGVYLINKKNINYISRRVDSSNGYTWKTTYKLFIHLIGDKDALCCFTYDEETYEMWLSMLGCN